MQLTAENMRVYDLLNDKLYTVPANQRKYVWKKNNWLELLDDIDLIYKENIESHFIGSVVLKKENPIEDVKKCYSVIDGQQRISTITILLVALGALYILRNQRELYKGLRKHLFVSDKRGGERPIVSSSMNPSISRLVEKLDEVEMQKEKLLYSLHDFISGYKLDRKVKECFEFFFESLEERSKDDNSVLEEYGSIICDINYIHIETPDEEGVYMIFEVLNARGQVLRDYELFRNYILRYTHRDEKKSIMTRVSTIEEILNDKVEIFLKHYALHKYGEKTNTDETRPYKIISKYEKENDKVELLSDMELKAKFYRRMLEPENRNPLEYKIFTFFKNRRQQQFRPIVLGLMHLLYKRCISQDTYDEYLNFLYEFFICYHVLGNQTSNKIQDVVDKYSSSLENDVDGTVVEQVLRDMRISMSKRIPDSKYFSNNVKNICYSAKYKAYSGSVRRDNVLAVFEVVERLLGYEGDFSEATIEHIIPDAKSEQNANIGNLLLLECDLNMQLKSKSLKDKIEIYKKSKFKAPHLIVESYEKIAGFDVSKRADRIAEMLFDFVSSIREKK
ncbi:MAG: DUF262 domain-containing protein [Akkermansia sp.]|nr:DUF262 domain-containing protein [Akkermansia sp.]